MYIKKAIFRKSHTTNVKQFANVNEERNLPMLKIKNLIVLTS